MGVAVSSWRLARAVSLQGPARRRVGNRHRYRRRATPAAGRSGRPPAHGPSTPFRCPKRPSASGTAISSRAARRPGAPFKSKPIPTIKMSSHAARPDRHQQLRRSVPRQGAARRPGRHQPARKGAAAQPGLAVRRDAGEGRRRADGRRHSAVDPGDPRSIRGRRAAPSSSSTWPVPAGRGVPHPARPAPVSGSRHGPLQRPQFLAIVSSSTLALTLARKSSGKVDGFVVEGATAGGHNAPPRGALKLDANGEPVYGCATRPISSRSARSACRSGWADRTAMRRSSSRRSRSAPAASRSARHSRSARNPGCHPR